jgi:hypothetical protein
MVVSCLYEAVHSGVRWSHFFFLSCRGQGDREGDRASPPDLSQISATHKVASIYIVIHII